MNQNTVDTQKNTDRYSADGEGRISFVSIVIPTYNSWHTLERCLHALFHQTDCQTDYEIIIVDDGSTDETAERIPQLAEQHPRIRYFQQPNRGPATARNLGAREARGELILFTDADCEPTPDWISEMVKPFTDSADPVVAVKGAYLTRQKNLISLFAQYEFESRYRKMLKSEYTDFVDTYSSAFRKSVFITMGGFDTSFPHANNEDTEFSYRLAARGYKMKFNPNAVVYHQHPHSIYTYLKQKFGRAYWRMVVYRSYPDKMKSDNYTTQTLKIQIALSFFLLPLWLLSLTGHPWVIAGAVLLTGVFLLTSLPFLSVMVLPRAKCGVTAKPPPAEKSAEYEQRTADHPLQQRLKHIVENILFSLGSVLKWFLHLPGTETIKKYMAQLFSGLLRLLVALPALVWKSVIVWPASALSWIIKAMLRALHAVSETAAARTIKDLGYRLFSTKLCMAVFSLLMMLLRGLFMGLGILWALQPYHAKKGRFIQTVMQMAGDAAGFAICYGAAIYLHYGFISGAPAPSEALRELFYFLPLLAGLLLVMFYMAGLYKPYAGMSSINECTLLPKTLMVSVLLMISILLLARIAIPIDIMGLFLVLSFLIVPGCRMVVRYLYSLTPLSNSERETTRVLIVGTGDTARLVMQRLQKVRAVHSQIIGFVSADASSKGQRIETIEILGSLRDLPKLVQDYEIMDVFLAMPMLNQEEVMNLIHESGGKRGVHFHIISNLFDLISAEVDIAEQNNIPIAYLKNEHAHLVYLVTKRFLDLGIAVFMAVASFPLWLLICLAIKMETRGPLLEKDRCVGKLGHDLYIYRFRTWHIHNGGDPAEHQQGLTQVGRFLKKTYLDEIPQLLNVMKGEMSMVGPRPEIPEIAATYTEWEKQRISVKPGLTGLWQLMGQRNLPIKEGLEYDIYYIKNQSFFLDIAILLKTIPVVLLGKKNGAEDTGHHQTLDP